jgi:nicotinamidase-related amidase
MNTSQTLPLPDFFDPQNAEKVWKIPYEERAEQARAWADFYGLQPAAQDKFRMGLLIVDAQNTFCIPGFELFVGGESGRGAVDDNQRLAAFIYRYLHKITQIAVTMDTHLAQQIFHAIFLVNKDGKHPEPYTSITSEDMRNGRWKFNPALAGSLDINLGDANTHLEHYTTALENKGKYELTIWPYHAMLGGIGHALVSLLEEALFFHTMARYTQTDFIQKGMNPWTEAYSAIGPEIVEDAHGNPIAQKDQRIYRLLKNLDVLIVAGQAKSHCVSWTLQDLLQQILEDDPTQVSKIYLLEDCSSAVVIPGTVDFTTQAEKTYQQFADAGMHIIRSTQPLEMWPNFPFS